MVKVAYLTSRFPKISETFILDELNAVDGLGADVALRPLRREPTVVMHPTAEEWCRRAVFTPFLSLPVARSAARVVAARPRITATAVSSALIGTLPSRRYLAGAVVNLPKVLSLADELRNSDVEHIHCHFASHSALAGYLLSLITGIPYSFTAHGSDLHRDQTMLGAKVAAASFVRTISEDNRRLIAEHSRPEDHDKIKVIPCGIDLDLFAGPPAPDPARLRIVCVGTLHEVKGQSHLIKALAELDRRGLAFSCIFVGDGPDRDKLEALSSEQGVDHSVRFAGLRRRPEVAEILAASDVLVAPSVPSSDGRREGIPVVLMEAMATGLPVVASRLSGIPELVADDESGLLVEPGNEASLTAALTRLHDDVELRSRLGQGGRDTVEESFNLRKNARRLVDLFEGASGRAA